MPSTRYEETAAHLRRRIEAGEYPQGSRLPSVRTLVTTYEVSGATIRAALRILESEGLVRAVLKSGIVVRGRRSRRGLAGARRISHDGTTYLFPLAAVREGEPPLLPGRPVTSFGHVPADVAAVLGVRAGARVVRRRVVLSPQGEEPWCLVDTWIPPRVVAAAPRSAWNRPGPGGYVARIEEAGYGPLAWEEIARAAMPSREEAGLLGISPLMPVMRILRVGRSAQDGLPAECSAHVIPADQVELRSALVRGPSARWPVAYD
ncbi:GntR family transcriptional regulator [Streptomyces sp. NPDC056519]|uniref:GntR family transcriptional regulator n=1 Tax=Streptomyces sp. NPDC056519 TaxID=3345849 RepID=UPI003675AC35